MLFCLHLSFLYSTYQGTQWKGLPSLRFALRHRGRPISQEPSQEDSWIWRLEMLQIPHFNCSLKVTTLPLMISFSNRSVHTWTNKYQRKTWAVRESSRKCSVVLQLFGWFLPRKPKPKDRTIIFKCFMTFPIRMFFTKFYPALPLRILLICITIHSIH